MMEGYTQQKTVFSPSKDELHIVVVVVGHIIVYDASDGDTDG